MNRSFFERIAHSLIFGQKTSDSLGNQMSEFPALLLVRNAWSRFAKFHFEADISHLAADISHLAADISHLAADISHITLSQAP